MMTSATDALSHRPQFRPILPFITKSATIALMMCTVVLVLLMLPMPHIAVPVEQLLSP
jgi:hypothetical protein